MFELNVATTNAAFENPAVELAETLRRLADKIEEKPWVSTDIRESIGMTADDGKVLDTNGNAVGTWTWSALS